MSLRLRLLNAWLRRVEKPSLSRATDVAALRRDFERKARLFFHAPRGLRHGTATHGGVACLTLASRADDGPILLYFFGGAFVFGSPRTHRAMLGALVARSGGRAILPEYRLAPEHPFPAQIKDARAVYDAVRAGADRPVLLGGDSAGGALALALLAELVRCEAPLPAGAFCLSPLTDMRFTAPSVAFNAEADAVLPVDRTRDFRAMFLGDASPDDPRASPLRADFTGAPPVWLTVGDTEILHDDSVAMAGRLRAQGVDVTLRVERDLPHVWPIFHNVLPEARATLDALAAWIVRVALPGVKGGGRP